MTEWLTPPARRTFGDCHSVCLSYGCTKTGLLSATSVANRPQSFLLSLTGLTGALPCSRTHYDHFLSSAIRDGVKDRTPRRPLHTNPIAGRSFRSKQLVQLCVILQLADVLPERPNRWLQCQEPMPPE